MLMTTYHVLYTIHTNYFPKDMFVNILRNVFFYQFCQNKKDIYIFFNFVFSNLVSFNLK